MDITDVNNVHKIGFEKKGKGKGITPQGMEQDSA